jgi:hypothetical protein
MSGIPMLSAAQWRLIESLLPETRRDRRMISAIVFREIDGASLRQVCAWFDVTRTRLCEWTATLEADGTLTKILSNLGLKRAGPLQWRRGGTSSWQRYSTDGGRSVVAMKLDRFAEQLRARKGHESAG